MHTYNVTQHSLIAGYSEGNQYGPSLGADFVFTELTLCYLIQAFKMLSTDWSTLRVHGIGENLALIFFIVTTLILVSK